MGTNRRYGSPAERAEAHRRRDAMITPRGRQRVQHCWVKAETSASWDEPDAPGIVVEWVSGANGIWYARVVYLHGESTVVDAWFPYTRLTPVQNP